MIKQEIEDLRIRLLDIDKKNLKSNDCIDEWRCSTCGGMYNRIMRHMDLKTSSKISKILKLASLKDLEPFRWYISGIALEYVLRDLDFEGYISMLIREAKTLDLSDWSQRSDFISSVNCLGRFTNDELSLLYSQINKRHLFEMEHKAIYEAKQLDWSRLDDVDRFIFLYKNYSPSTKFFTLFSKIVERATLEAVENLHESLTETLILTLKKKAIEYPELVGYALQISTHNKQMKRVLYNTLREYIKEVNDYRGDREGRRYDYY